MEALEKNMHSGGEMELNINARFADRHLNNPDSVEALQKKLHTALITMIPRVDGDTDTNYYPHNHRNIYGGRDYVDMSRAEISLPECESIDHLMPQELLGEARSEQAFELAVRQVEEELKQSILAQLTKKNCSEPFQRDFTTWGIHGNHQTTREHVPSPYHESKPVIDSLIAHGVSRLPLFGAGGFIGTKYWVSPRTHAIYYDTGSETTTNRPIINFREHPVVTDRDRYGRWHDINREGSMSPWQIRHSFAAPRLVCDAIMSGVSFADLKPREPVKAMHAVGQDLSLNATILVRSGKRLTARAIDREILRRIEQSGVASTTAARQTIDEWKRMLDELDAYSRTRIVSKYMINLDWAAKIRLADTYDHLSLEIIDRDYARLTNKTGKGGYGKVLREQGRLALMPTTDISTNKPGLPSSRRAKMRGLLCDPKLRTAGVTVLSWFSYRLSDSLEVKFLPDFPTEEDVEDLTRQINEIKDKQAA